MAPGFYLFLVVAVIVTLIVVAGPLWDNKRQLWAELDWRERLMLCLAALAFPCIIWLPVVVLIMASPYLPWLENVVPKFLAPAERLGSDHPSFGGSLNNMAELYRAEGRYTEAELLFKRALAIYEKASGPDHPDVSLPLSNIAGLYGDQGRYVEAEALYRRALAIREKAFGPDHPTVGIVLNNLAGLYRTQGRYTEAEPLYRRVLAIYEIAFGPNHPSTGDGLNNLALLLRDQGRYAEAEPRLKRSLAIRQGSLGADHPDVGIGLNNLAELYLAQGRYAEAVPVYKRSLVILETVLEGRSSRESDRDASSAREMFQIAQMASEAAASLTQMAARGVKDDLRLAAVERDLQDLFVEWQKRDGARTAAILQSPGSRDRTAEVINEVRLREIDRRLAEIDERQKLEIPEHAAFRHLEPLNAGEVQAKLRSDEALVLYLDIPGSTSPPTETIAWVITKTDVRWQRIDLDTKALTENVTALRCGLDPMLWKDAQSADQCRALVQLSPVERLVDGQTIEILPFNLTHAHTLYRALLGAFRDIVKDKSLLIVPSRLLTSLPFNVLVTESPKTAIPRTLAEYRDVSWLGTLQPITVLPSVSSMRALHQRGKTKSGASRTYLGIGNPLLDGKHPEWGQYYKEQAKASPGKQECPGTLAERRAEVATRPVISLKLRTQDPLPETADELCEVGRRLGAPNSDILLGSRATEGALRNLSREGRLAQYRIVHFATHCALPGQLQGVVEPGLVLTPTPMGAPDAGKLDRDDGFLTASEIAALKLDADWVVLSGCNTVGSSSENGGALSSLASAFFYAGARTLLVSHWEVGSQNAIKLISGVFAELRTKPNLGRAEAMRISMRNLMTNASLVEAHPSLWAPFVVVGEGAAN